MGPFTVYEISTAPKEPLSLFLQGSACSLPVLSDTLHGFCDPQTHAGSLLRPRNPLEQLLGSSLPVRLPCWPQPGQLCVAPPAQSPRSLLGMSPDSAGPAATGGPPCPLPTRAGSRACPSLLGPVVLHQWVAAVSSGSPAAQGTAWAGEEEAGLSPPLMPSTQTAA